MLQPLSWYARRAACPAHVAKQPALITFFNKQLTVASTADHSVIKTMPNTFREQVWEFLVASGQPHSYNLAKNVYIWFGILWGLPIPLASVLFQALFLDSRDLTVIIQAVLHTPIQYLFLAHPVLFGLLFGILGTIRQQKDHEVSQLIEELRQMSIIDPLTGLANRRYFSQQFGEELARIRRKHTPLSLIFLDLDHFKGINDKHGHRTGDEVLRLTASHLRTHCRPYDLPARWGGEEFIILLPDTGEDMAAQFAERVRLDFTRNLAPHVPFAVTVSIGVAAYRPDETLEQFAERADQALYNAKVTGRNRMVRWSSLAAT